MPGSGDGSARRRPAARRPAWPTAATASTPGRARWRRPGAAAGAAAGAAVRPWGRPARVRLPVRARSSSSSSARSSRRAAFVLSRLGPVPGLVALGLVVVAAGRLGGRFADGPGRSTSWSRRRVGSRPATTRSGSGQRRGGSRARPRAGPRLRHDGRPPRDRRAPAAHAARRRQPRAADAARGHHGQPRGDPRRRLPGRRGAPRRRSSTRRASSARLIDDLRTLALSEAGTLALHREPTDPDVLVGDVVRSFEPAATARPASS